MLNKDKFKYLLKILRVYLPKTVGTTTGTHAKQPDLAQQHQKAMKTENLTIFNKSNIY
jgi:hypothetical protein